MLGEVTAEWCRRSDTMHFVWRMALVKGERNCCNFHTEISKEAPSVERPRKVHHAWHKRYTKRGKKGTQYPSETSPVC